MAQNANSQFNMVGMASSTAFMNKRNKCFPKICRICLLAVKDNLCKISIDYILIAEDLSFCDKLYYCCPELDLRIKSKPFLCVNCFKTVNVIHEFIHRYDKNKSQFHEYFTCAFPSIQNFHLLKSYTSLSQDKIKTEDIDLSDIEQDFLNKHTKNQNIAETLKPLQNNFINNTSIKPVKCSFCDYNFTTKSTLKKHPCRKDSSSFMGEYNKTKSHDLKMHVHTHTQDKTFRCCVCSYTSIRRSHLKRHMKIHTGEKPFRCFMCNYSCIHKHTLKYHMKIHTGEKPFKCSVCNYSCVQKCNLRNHMKTHSGKNPFSCSLCDYSSIKKSTLRCHMKIHAREKQLFTCFVCNYNSIRKGNLLNHMKIHNGEKPFHCSACDCNFKHKSSLKRHMSIHTGEKPFKCLECDYCCIEKSRLKTHMIIHTDKKPIKCFKCDYCCIRKNQMSNHVKFHTRRKPV